MPDLPDSLAEALHDRYALQRELGRGGMATVYLATDLRHKRQVALKVLDPAVGARLGRERFLREIETAAQLQHPHILPVHDSGEAAGLLWYTMPYVEGESLRDRLRREAQLPLADAVRIASEVADALGYAHVRGVVHRDIKPENILLSGYSPGGRDSGGSVHALVADFGVARAVQGSDTALTETGMSVGTPVYMSPEQSLADPRLDGRSDVYSLGCVLYEMLTGEPPYTGSTAQAIIAKRLHDPVPSALRLRETVPVAVDQALQRAMAKTPADRYQTAAAFVDALGRESLQGHGGMVTAELPNTTSPGSARPPARSRKTVLVALAAAALVALAVATGLLARRGRGAEPDTSPAAVTPLPLVAVLPLETIGSDTSQRYFTAGMTEELSGQLSRLGGLRVVSTAVAQGYASSADGLPRMARELGVSSVVGGSVRRAGDQVRIAVHLADARSGQTVWSDQYDRPLADVLAVQSDVARQVATALQAKFTPEDSSRLTRRARVDPTAHDLLLRSGTMSYFDSTETRAGIQLLRRALAIDSGYAEAWVELALRYSFMSVYGDPAFLDSARTLARRALAIDPELDEAYAILGDVESQAGLVAASGHYYEKALALNRSNLRALADLSFARIVLGRPDEGLRLAIQAAPLAGNHPVFYYHVGAALLRLGRDRVTEAWLQAGARKTQPPYVRLEIQLSALDLLRGRDSLALERARRLSRRSPGDEEVQSWLAELSTILGTAESEGLTGDFMRRNASARPGTLLAESFAALHGLTLYRRGERRRADSLWDAALETDERDRSQGQDNPDRYVQTAAIHAIRGDSAGALDWLSRGYKAGWNDARTLTRDPFFAPLGDAPRFRSILQQMNADIARQADGVRSLSDSLASISTTNTAP